MWRIPYGPPYALIQGTLDTSNAGQPGTSRLPLTNMRREHTPAARRGHACLIGEGPDFFVSLADHPEWGSGHTVWGIVDDMTLFDAIAQLPVEMTTWGDDVHVTPLVTPIPFTLTMLSAGM